MTRVIGFHNPDERYGFLSNWYLSNFEVDGISFTSMEQYMMYEKAKVFSDKATAIMMLKTNDVAVIKALGRGVQGYNEVVWNGVRQVIIYKGLLAKFSQNKELKEMLLATGDSILAECAVKDRIWGIGLSMTDSKKEETSEWKGQNLLGFSLMLVRSALRGE